VVYMGTGVIVLGMAPVRRVLQDLRSLSPPQSRFALPSPPFHAALCFPVLSSAILHVKCLSALSGSVSSPGHTAQTESLLEPFDADIVL